jgi:Ca2+-binding EF-hand superfamily protein
LEFARHQGVADWMWFIMLGAMMLGFYYFLAVFVEDEEEIEEDFEHFDRDHDGYISRDDAGSWKPLVISFDKYDADHDGRLSRLEFQTFEHALPRH